MNTKPLEESLLESIARSDLKDTAVECAELGLDLVLDEGVVRDIPVIGALVSVTSSVASIRDRLLAKKLLRFLAELSVVPPDERRRQIERLAASPRERQRVGENLMLLLDRLDDIEKPELLARAFQAFLEERIDRTQFQALARVIDSIIPDLVSEFRTGYEAYRFHKVFEPSEEISHFLQCGLLSMKFAKIETDTTAYFGGGSKEQQEAGYLELNSLGTLFYKVILNVDAETR